MFSFVRFCGQALGISGRHPATGPCFGKRLKGKNVEDLLLACMGRAGCHMCRAPARSPNDPGRLIAA